MAAPSGTVWGSIVGGYGRIGLYVKLENTNTTTKRTTQVWFWSKYSVTDSSNTLYYNDQSKTATTSKGSVSIKTSSDSGGWSTANQVMLKEYTYEFTRGTSAKVLDVAAKLTGIEAVGGAMTVTTSYTVPALASYAVKYNANGGSGAPANQTKYYGKTLKLSTTKPTRSGYTFVGWGTSASDTTADYNAGDNYTANKAITLYAIWKKTITLTYDANGGSGAPAKQSVTIWNATTSNKFTLSSTIPTRTGYTFLGWSTSKTATSASYSAGGSVTLSSNTTLYAVWKINTYRLTINPNGGSWNGSTSSSSVTQAYQSTKTIPVPTWAGHTFSGWEISGAGTISSPNAVQVTYTFGAGDGTLKARWDRNDYSIIFDAESNGGVCTEKERIVQYGDKIGILPEATKKNYVFLGWFTAKTGGTQVTENLVVKQNYILYAHFELDASAYIKATGNWKAGVVYVNDSSGKARKGHAMVNVNGAWKDGIS